MKCCGRKTRYSILLIVGVTFIVLPFALNDYINDTIQKTIDRKVVIKPGSQIYSQWRKPTLPIYLMIRTFNIVNPVEVKQGKPPVVIEKGPYSYKENREKVNISWGKNTSTVTYNQVTKYVFDSKTSCATCDPSKDKFTTFNIPFITITQLIKQLNTYDLLGWKELLAKFLNIIKDDIFIEKTVNETIWGYDDPSFKLYNDFRGLLLDIPIIKKLAKKYLPVIPTFFALQPNPSFDGITTVKTGQSSVDDVGCYKEWKGYKVLPYWNSAIANRLNGTDGSLYKPRITKNDALYIFITQLCRSLDIVYYSDETIKGIGALRFHAPKSTFESGSINPNNKGFCVPNCLLSGLLSIKTCLPLPAPIMVSSPHFLNGDPILQKKVLGLHPNEEKHDTFVYVEPNTGILLEASKRIQFNLHVERVDGFPSTYGLVPTPVPIMWVNEHVTIDSKDANMLKKDLLMTLVIIKWVKIGLVILGIVLVVIALVLFGRLCWQRKNGHGSLVKVASNGKHNYGATSSDNHALNPSLINASD